MLWIELLFIVTIHNKIKTKSTRSSNKRLRCINRALFLWDGSSYLFSLIKFFRRGIKICTPFRKSFSFGTRDCKHNVSDFLCFSQRRDKAEPCVSQFRLTAFCCYWCSRAVLPLFAFSFKSCLNRKQVCNVQGVLWRKMFAPDKCCCQRSLLLKQLRRLHFWLAVRPLGFEKSVRNLWQLWSTDTSVSNIYIVLSRLWVEVRLYPYINTCAYNREKWIVVTKIIVHN